MFHLTRLTDRVKEDSRREIGNLSRDDLDELLSSNLMEGREERAREGHSIRNEPWGDTQHSRQFEKLSRSWQFARYSIAHGLIAWRSLPHCLVSRCLILIVVIVTLCHFSRFAWDSLSTAPHELSYSVCDHSFVTTWHWHEAVDSEALAKATDSNAHPNLALKNRMWKRTG